MRLPISRSVILAAFVLCGGFTSADEPDDHPVPLTFYSVSEYKVAGWTYIDSPQFPKLGYISPTPDLVINQLKAVEPFQAQSIQITTDANGESQTQQKTSPGLKITLLEADAPGFTALSNRALKHRVLIMQGDRPLLAPMMTGVITEPKFTIDLSSSGDDKKVQAALAKLVK